MQYGACVSEPVHLPQTVEGEFTLSLEPDDATCGGNSVYCTMGIRNCTYCQDNQHTTEFMFDRNTDNTPVLDTWWQSWTWAGHDGIGSYPTALEVNVTLSFNKSYELAEDIVITWRGSRPQEMILEKSTDNGGTWEILQIYAMSCSEYFAQGYASQISEQAPDQVICTQMYSQETPYVNGEVVFSATDRFTLFLGEQMNDYDALYNAFDTTNLDEFLLFTDLRFRLLLPATDGQEVFGQNVDLVQYYYAIGDIDIVAGCYCHLHARICTAESNVRSCICEHNTEGYSCERCLPLYNNRPWQVGLYSGAANECRKCECYDHADSCVYNATLQTGVCISCYHNTQGIHCGECVPDYYRNATLELNDPNVCIPCDCEPQGVEGNDTSCSSPGGQCNCKDLVAGLMCDVCVDQYYGLLQVEVVGECTPCDCDLDGTVALSNVCEKELGQCPCKPYITGRRCEGCLPGYYNYPQNTPQNDCTDCDCLPGGSTTHICDVITGSCTCNPGMSGRRCDTVESGYYVPSLDADLYQGVSGSCTEDTAIHSTAQPYTGRTFYRCTEGQQLSFEAMSGADMASMPLQWYAYPVLRYSLTGDSPWLLLQMELQVTGASEVDLSTYEANYNTTVADNSCREDSAPTIIISNLTVGSGLSWRPESNVTIDIRCVYTISLVVGGPGNATAENILIDSVVLMPDIAMTDTYQLAEPSKQIVYDECVSETLNLATNELAHYRADCQDLTKSVMSEMHTGSLACDCDSTGTVASAFETCQAIGGQCSCKAGVFGRRCDQCAPGHFNFTSTGCTACQCAEGGSINLVCDYETGQCPCHTNVAIVDEMNTLGVDNDKQCRACKVDFFGYHTGLGCESCLCNTDGSLISQCSDQGICMCNDTIGGDKCDTCQPGYYAFSSAGCTLCSCDSRGSLGVECEADTGQCQCKVNADGQVCDLCQVGTFNLKDDNFDGCQPCFCYGHGNGCESAAGYIALTITAATVDSWFVGTPDIVLEPDSVRDYASASGDFYGDRVYAYANFLSLDIEPINDNNFDLRQIQPIVITGNDLTMFYNDNETEITLRNGSPTSVQFMFHEKFWWINETYNPSALELQTLLQGLDGLFIIKQWGMSRLTITDVTLVSAEAGSGEAVTYVESCSCVADHHVDGPFCENCAQGFYRLTVNGSSYETCQACDCNGNSATEQATPPEPAICDEDTGLCLNCRDGTTGDHCEACSENVLEEECEECVDEFWNISQTGCEPCLCDSVGSSSAVCDKVTGQCECRDTTTNTITGRQCNECVDNFYDLQEAGCTECDTIEETCYSLVFAEVEILREKRDNLTTYVTYIMNNDNNTELGSFTDRLDSMMTSMAALVEYLSNAQSADATVGQQIATLNLTLQTLRETVEIDIAHTILVANNTCIEAEGFMSAAREVRDNMTSTATQAFIVMQGGIGVALGTIGDMVQELTEIENQLTVIESGAAGANSGLLDTVATIEDTARQAVARGNEAQAIAQATQTQYESTHTSLTDLATAIDSTEADAAGISLDAGYTSGNASALNGELQDLQNSVNAISTPDVDEAALMADAARYIEEATDLEGRSVNATGENSDITAEVEEVQANTTALLEQVSSQVSNSDGLVVRVQTAYDNGMTAQVLEEDTFNNATRMQEVMQDFATMHDEVQLSVETALDKVGSVRSMSEAAIAQSQDIQTRLAPAQTSSENAKQTAIHTLAQAQAVQAEMVNVTLRSTSLETASQPQLNGLTTQVANIAVANVTQVVPAYETCEMLTESVTILQADATNALDQAESSLAAVEATQQRIETVMASIRNIQQLDATEISTLRAEVVALRSAFDQSQLADAISALQAQKERQSLEIEAMASKKVALQNRVDRLKLLRDQLHVG